MAEAIESTFVLVTGASGYIASHIIQQLQEAGYKVRGSVRSLQDEDKVKRLNELVPEPQYKLELVEADLTKAESWEPAVKDITHVIHVASPFPIQQPKDENEVVQPAVEGTQAILKACVTAKSVKRVVMTSSVNAIAWSGIPADPNKSYNEEDWMDADKLDPYGKSKTLAEKAAWDFVKELPDEDKIQLAVINPGYVMGPVLSGSYCSSMEVEKKLLERGMMFVPKLNFPIVDVRDVAAAHIKAMTLPEADGKRHILVNQNMWLKEMAQILAKEFKPKGYNVPTTNCPNAMLHFVGLFDKSLKSIIPMCGKVYKYDNSRMKEVLGITPRESKDTLVDMAYSMIEGGFVKRSKKYKGQNAGGEEEEKAEEKAEEEKKEGEGEEKTAENGEVKEGEVKELEPEDKEGEKEKEQKAEEKKEEEKKDEEAKAEEKTETTEEVKTEEKKEEEKKEEAPAEK